MICWKGPSGVVYHGEPFAAYPGGYRAAEQLAWALNDTEPGVLHWVEVWRG